MEQPAKAKSSRSISAEFKKVSKKEILEPVEIVTAIAVEGSNGVHQDSILHGMPPVATHSSEVKLEEEEEHIDVGHGCEHGNGYVIG